MNKKEFKKFFKVHSKNVDNAESQGFWKLTDAILERIILENLKRRKKVTIVDFGGGTGRWFEKLDKYFQDSEFIIVDLSKDMLKQAEKKIKSGRLKNKLSVINSNIEDIDQIKSNSVDYIISTYNPLSFCNKPQLAVKEAFRVLKINGVALITVQGYHNALFSKVNNYLASAKELKDIFDTKKVKWNPLVPSLLQLDKDSMEKMFAKAGFRDVSSRGIACITQPQLEDFDQHNLKIGSLSRKLNKDKKFFQTLLDIELQLSAVESVQTEA